MGDRRDSKGAGGSGFASVRSCLVEGHQFTLRVQVLNHKVLYLPKTITTIPNIETLNTLWLWVLWILRVRCFGGPGGLPLHQPRQSTGSSGEELSRRESRHYTQKNLRGCARRPLVALFLQWLQNKSLNQLRSHGSPPGPSKTTSEPPKDLVDEGFWA